MKYSKKIITTLACLAGFAGTSEAATLTLQNLEPTPKMQLVIDDSVGPDLFKFTLTTLVGTADFLGLGFNFTGIELEDSDFALVGATNASDVSITPTLALFGNNTGSQTDCGPGCNFSGAGSATDFDYILRIGSNGGNAENFVKTVTFTIATDGDISTLPFYQFAVRAQSTSNPGGSIKADLYVPTKPQNPPQVPLPASIGFLIAGLGGLVALKKRKAA